MSQRTLSVPQQLYIDHVLGLRPGTVRCMHCGQPFRVRNNIAFSLPECEPMHLDCIDSKFMYHKNQVVSNPNFSEVKHVYHNH